MSDPSDSSAEQSAVAPSTTGGAEKNADCGCHRGRRLAAFVGALLLLAIGYLVLAPAPIDAVAFDPPPATELTGPLAPNTDLRSAELLATGQIVGPEDVEVDAEGNIFAGVMGGKIVRISPDGKNVETFAETDGRPLGLAFAPDGNLIVADGVKGLLSIDKAGKITVLATEAEGEPFGFTDDLDIARDGTVYFSDASSKFGANEYLYDLLEARPHGRLLCYEPATGKARVLVDDLYFANGIALSEAEDFVLVNETYRFRITRYWLKGEKAGTSDIFIDNLPGFPDSISANRHGTFWLALFTVRNPTLDWLSPHATLKNVMAKLPMALWPKPDPYGFVVAINEQGEIVRSFQDPGGENLREITSAHEHDGALYLGSLSANRIGRYKLP